jgi:hypothetical protein
MSLQLCHNVNLHTGFQIFAMLENCRQQPSESGGGPAVPSGTRKTALAYSAGATPRFAGDVSSNGLRLLGPGPPGTGPATVAVTVTGGGDSSGRDSGDAGTGLMMIRVGLRATREPQPWRRGRGVQVAPSPPRPLASDSESESESEVQVSAAAGPPAPPRPGPSGSGPAPWVACRRGSLRCRRIMTRTRTRMAMRSDSEAAPPGRSGTVACGPCTDLTRVTCCDKGVKLASSEEMG